MIMDMSKQALREELRQARQAMPIRQRVLASQSICESLISLDKLKEACFVHLYDPIEKLAEVDIRPIYDFLLARNIELYSSRKVDGRWQVVSISSGELVLNVEPDVVIIPMLGFDTSLHRVGYGAGYYDRLLKSLLDTYKIGVCYNLGLVEHIPSEPHDIAMNIIVSEERIYT
jgi:5-formyltetrahydrofolate cyclo-ligase